jgi:hypothetical protein
MVVKVIGGQMEGRSQVHVALYECEECGHVGRIEHTGYEEPLVIARQVHDDHKTASPRCPGYQNPAGKNFQAIERRPSQLKPTRSLRTRF